MHVIVKKKSYFHILCSHSSKYFIHIYTHTYICIHIRTCSLSLIHTRSFICIKKCEFYNEFFLFIYSLLLDKINILFFYIIILQNIIVEFASNMTRSSSIPILLKSIIDSTMLQLLQTTLVCQRSSAAVFKLTFAYFLQNNWVGIKLPF